MFYYSGTATAGRLNNTGYLLTYLLTLASKVGKYLHQGGWGGGGRGGRAKDQACIQAGGSDNNKSWP